MHNPSRRNRNIGTAKQGHGSNNRMRIADSRHDFSIYWQRLGKYQVVNRVINWREFTFLVEETRENSFHSCTVDDLCHLLKMIPDSDLEGLNLIVLRQPKRKEELLRPVWGRLGYYVEIGKFSGPAIMLEAYDFTRKAKWSKKLGPDDQKELERLKADGHEITEDKRNYRIRPSLTSVRNTQLYRTFLHEYGHWVHYLEQVERPGQEGEDIDIWQVRSDLYDKIPTQEKEVFAHAYADEMKARLEKNDNIPFDRKLDEASLASDGLHLKDFA